MRPLLRLTLLSLAFVLATAFLGWWSVPSIGVLWGVVAKRHAHPGLTAASAAGLAWAALLVLVAVQGPMWMLADKVGAILAIPGWLFIFVTLAFPALLAGTAAVVGETASRVLEFR
jgi:hypothetical protein